MIGKYMEVDINYRNAFSELIVLLRSLPQSELLKIPYEEVEFYTKNMNEDYKFEYDYSKTIDEQNISMITKDLLANIYIYYLADNKEELIAEEEKCEIVIKNDTFEKKEKTIIDTKTDLIVIEEEKNIFKKIISKIREFLHRLT